MKFDKDIFFTITQMCAGYGGIVQDWQEELHYSVKHTNFKKAEILKTWELLIEQKIDQLLDKINL